MLTSIASSAVAITTLIGVGYKLYDSYKKSKAAKEAITRDELVKLLKGAKTDDERQKYSKMLHSIDSK